MNTNKKLKISELRKSCSLPESFTDECVWKIYMRIKNFRRLEKLYEYDFTDAEIYDILKVTN